MNWGQAFPAIAVAALLMFLPGLVLARALGAKGFASAAMSPLASCGLIGLAGVVGGLLRLGWGLFSYLLVTAVCTGLAFLLRRFLRGRVAPVAPASAAPAVQWAAILGGMVAGSVLILTRLLPAIGKPGNFGQVYDNIFHLNAIRYILETGNASSLTLGRMLSPDAGIAIYPSVWHSLAALVAQLTSSDVFVSENAVIVAVSALLWPFACIMLVRGITGPRVLPLVVAGALSGGFWMFPFQLLQWGPLYPNTLAYSLLPLALLVLVGLFRAGRERFLDDVSLWSFLLIAVAALFLSQPNGVTALLAFSVPLIAAAWFSQLRVRVRTKAGFRPIALVVLWGFASAAAFLLVWQALLLNFDSWKPSRTLDQAVGDVATGTLLGGGETMVASVAALLGIITIIWRRRGGWIIACGLIAAALYVVAVVMYQGRFRHFTIGSWYQDPYRLAALVPLFMIVLGSVGADGLVTAVRGWLRRIASKRSTGRRLGLPEFRGSGSLYAIAAAAILALALSTLVSSVHSPGLDAISTKIKNSYSYYPGWAVSSDEFALMSRLDATVPKDAVIGVNPFNGGTLAYAISGRHVTQYHLSPGPDEDLRKIAMDVTTSQTGAETCRLAEQEHVHYILDFGRFYILNFVEAQAYPAFDNVAATPGAKVELVDHQGAAKLYKITAC
ncbi:DUF6541 family protein [Arthrobacter sp. ov118]|uniref:DUF6541 family protein n=1 Tax=Arthrobacter sp. ov118 TaxID=1761747 RepID=UPI0008E09779|nr:DUF6541 family protein [Arthrobacter sp. ov118]SFT36769.1 hypothetical protein SAMN04487915_10160 [Arthrobacter sp. ov118]